MGGERQRARGREGREAKDRRSDVTVHKRRPAPTVTADLWFQATLHITSELQMTTHLLQNPR